MCTSFLKTSHSVGQFLVPCLYILLPRLLFFFGGESVCDNTIYFHILSIRLLISIKDPKGTYMFSCQKRTVFKRPIQYGTEYHLKHKEFKKHWEKQS